MTARRSVPVPAVLIACLVLFGAAARAPAQENYPTRPIEIISPFAPGGSTDVLARFIAENLKKRWGVPVNVTNKPGGNTVPAQLEVYKAKPDGYTMFSDSQSSCSLLEVAVKDLPVKVLDRSFIAFIGASPSVFWVPASSTIKDLRDVEAEIKKAPEHFTWATLGGAGAGDFTMRQFLKAMRVDIAKTRPVVVRGGSEAITQVAGGHVKLTTSSPTSGLSHLRAGTIRAIGVTGKRSPDFPEVPTAEEQGYPGVNVLFWAGVSGPPKLPPHIVAKWDEALREMLKDKAFLDKLRGMGFEPFYHGPTEAKEYVRKEMEEAARLWGVK